MPASLTITDNARKLLAVLTTTAPVLPGSIPRVSVSDLTSQAAVLYEKIRNIIDYQEEHLLRKNAIERILKRRRLGERDGRELARPLINELIRARYLPNNTLPESIVDEVSHVIDRYAALIKNTPKPSFATSNKLTEWILDVAAADVEHTVVPPVKEDALVELMYRVIYPHIVFPDEMNDEERSIQAYIAIHRSLIRSDRAILRYHLFHYHWPEWRSADAATAGSRGAEIAALAERIDAAIRHPRADQLFRRLKKYTIFFHVLRDIIEKDLASAEKLLTDPVALERAVRAACHQRYGAVREKLRRSSFRVVVYVFMTKMLLALLIELPYDLFIASTYHLVPLAINITVHPLLLLLAALIIRVPSEENTRRIVRGVQEIIWDTPERIAFQRIGRPLARGPVMSFLLNLTYALAFVITFGLLIWGLQLISFNWLSGTIFIFFLSIISFFALRVREAARELVVVRERENGFTVLVDFLSMPVLRLGRRIALIAPSFNVFLFILDFIIEAPFKTVLEIIEDWLSFVREKKEEIL